LSLHARYLSMSHASRPAGESDRAWARVSGLAEAGGDAGSEVAAVCGVALEAEHVVHEAVPDLVGLECRWQ
jgi:hypothetical protein